MAMTTGLFSIIAAFAAGWLLTRLPPPRPAVRAEMVDALLPQTQCGKCGYPGCRPYAEAIAAGHADINQCPPGGARTIRSLARLLGRETRPLDPARGPQPPPQVALIDESVCIGCVKCIRACPVDAIVGAPKQLHTIIAAECTGCELCLPPCPVDCITMVPPTTMGSPWPKPAGLRRQS